jgi:hypothetical protein
VHALAVRVLEVPGLVRAAGRAEVVGRHELRALVVEDESPPMPLLVQEPHAAVRAHACLPDEAGLARHRFEHAGREVVPVEARPALEDVVQQERRAVGPPVRHEDAALEVGREVRPLARREIPDPRPLVPLELVLERQAPVARNR